MAEYITKESALKALGQIRKGFRDMDEKCVIDSCILEVMSIYPSDVVEVKRGRWINERMLIGGFAEKWGCDCSICGETFEEPLWKPNYCPNCGARMD